MVCLINGRVLAFALVVFTVLVMAGCTASAAAQPINADVVEAMAAPVNESFARAFAPREFVFPRDHGPHPEYRTEWWYYTGNLSAADGTPYGYQLTFFRTALASDPPARASDLATNQIYMAHFALADGGRKNHVSFDRYSRGAAGLAGATGDPGYRVWVENWKAAETEPGVYRLLASADHADGPVAIDLTLRETRPPIFHGDRGLHQKGPEPGNASYYYSLVGLQSTGVITRAGQAIPVTGMSWMDHEFSTRTLSGDAVGWDWFSVQLENGAVLMLYEIRNRDGSAAPGVEGTLVWPDGRQQALTEDDFVIDVIGLWNSPMTGIAYPSGWVIELPDLEIELEILPLIADQEMDVSFAYWEGAVEADGMMAGEKVRGRGYVELTGYGSDGGAYQR